MGTRIAKGTREELLALEEGSWADHGCPEEGHVYPILRRLRTRLDIRDRREAEIVLNSLSYWADAQGMMTWTPAFGRALRRICREIRAEFPAPEHTR